MLVLSLFFFTIFSSMRDKNSKILCKKHNVDMTETIADKRRLELTKPLIQNMHNEQKSNSIRTCSLNNNNKQTHDQKRSTIMNLGAGTNKRKDYPINIRKGQLKDDSEYNNDEVSDSRKMITFFEKKEVLNKINSEPDGNLTWKYFNPSNQQRFTPVRCVLGDNKVDGVTNEFKYNIIPHLTKLVYNPKKLMGKRQILEYIVSKCPSYEAHRKKYKIQQKSMLSTIKLVIKKKILKIPVRRLIDPNVHQKWSKHMVKDYEPNVNDDLSADSDYTDSDDDVELVDVSIAVKTEPGSQGNESVCTKNDMLILDTQSNDPSLIK